MREPAPGRDALRAPDDQDVLDVLIIGAGPTGLMLATQLARRGVRVAIVDRNHGPALETRAIGVQARTLEIYDRLGIADAALELGRRATGANLWARGRRTARVPLGDIGRGVSPFPFLLILGQDDNERLLAERLRGLGVTVRRDAELVALRQDADEVVATLRGADGGLREIRVRWLAGCDGGRSTVRELCGIAFEGAAYEQVFFVADTTARGPMVEGELNVFLWRGGFHLFFPMRGTDRWRVVGILPRALRGRDDVGFADLVPGITTEVGPGLTFAGCAWFSTYRIHHRRAARFRAGRCFLLGDAAHVHSPLGAQGMNTGLQDAWNLAWKLALVVRSGANPRLLESYAAEREPVATRLLATTDRAFEIAVSDRRGAALLRTWVVARVIALAMRCGAVRRLAFRTISQTGIAYRESPLAVTRADLGARAPKAGERFPWLRLGFARGAPAEDLFARLDDRCFNLLVFGQPEPAPGDCGPLELVRVHTMPGGPGDAAALAGAGIPMPSYFLLRPDGHVGLVGARYEREALAAYFAGPLGLGAAFRRSAEPAA